MGKLLNQKNKVVLLICIIFLSWSCDYTVIENPGPQISSSISISKKNKVFICEYKVKAGKINGAKIESIFAEKKYFSDVKLFSGFKIDNNKSQLIVVSKDNLVFDGQGFGIDWSIKGFNVHSGKIVYCNYNGTILPDTINISLIGNINGDKLDDHTTFYKQKNK